MAKYTDNRNIRILSFLEAYERQESLWNPALDSYKNRMARDQAYTQIIKDLNIPSLTVHDVKLKVKSVRTTYTKELRLLTKHRKEGKPYTPKLFWFNKANAFLKNVSLFRDKRVIFPTHEILSNDYKDCTVEFITDFTNRQRTIEDGNCDDQSTEIDVSPHQPTNYDYKTLHSVDIQTYAARDRGIEINLQRNKAQYQNIKHSFDTGTRDFSTSSNASKKEMCNFGNSLPQQVDGNDFDEFDIFCRSVATQLRNITDPYSRSVAKLKIQQILFEAETGHYEKSRNITIPVTQLSNM